MHLPAVLDRVVVCRCRAEHRLVVPAASSRWSVDQAAAAMEEAYRWRAATYPHLVPVIWAVMCVSKAAAVADVAGVYRCVLARNLWALWWSGVEAALLRAAVPCVSEAAPQPALATQDRRAWAAARHLPVRPEA